jgi:hypothetical protein
VLAGNGAVILQPRVAWWNVVELNDLGEPDFEKLWKLPARKLDAGWRAQAKGGRAATSRV